MPDFVIHALPAGDVDLADPVARSVTASGREPCRRCLRNAEAGEKLLLLPYDPFVVRSPYAGAGPVFVHEGGCEQFEPLPGRISEQVAGRTLALRSYDAAGMMVEHRIVGEAEFVASAGAMLDDGDYLHAHFASPGCFAFRVDRAA